MQITMHGNMHLYIQFTKDGSHDSWVDGDVINEPHSVSTNIDTKVRILKFL